MSWNVKVVKRVLKEVKRFSKKDVKRLFSVLEGLAEDPYQGSIEKIRGEKNIWRRRCGNYRILYEVISRGKYVYIFQIRRRTTTTYRKQK